MKQLIRARELTSSRRGEKTTTDELPGLALATGKTMTRSLTSHEPAAVAAAPCCDDFQFQPGYHVPAKKRIQANHDHERARGDTIHQHL
jgi:hypothetical protein